MGRFAGVVGQRLAGGIDQGDGLEEVGDAFAVRIFHAAEDLRALIRHDEARGDVAGMEERLGNGEVDFLSVGVGAGDGQGLPLGLGGEFGSHDDLQGSVVAIDSGGGIEDGACLAGVEEGWNGEG